MGIKDGRNDLRRNGIWIQHGWLGDDKWFEITGRNKRLYRDIKKIKEIASQFSCHGILYVYPHLCPTRADGKIPDIDESQAKLFLNEMKGFKVLPWIGGIRNEHCFLGLKEWRKKFLDSILTLFSKFPDLAGIHINIEPMPSGEQDFIELLKEIKNILPQGKILSVAAYPPPTIWHRFNNVHWDKIYYQQISKYADQMVIMMYDTAITDSKLYQSLISSWTYEVLCWQKNSKILLGVPVYDDKESGYHNPNVENLKNSIMGINRGLSNFKKMPDNYDGIAIYCEWEIDKNEWEYLRRNFLKR